MKCKCGYVATVFVDAAGIELDEPMCNMCFIENDREAEALVADALGRRSAWDPAEVFLDRHRGRSLQRHELRA